MANDRLYIGWRTQTARRLGVQGCTQFPVVAGKDSILSSPRRGRTILGISEQGFIDRLVNEEIRRLVAEAVEDGGMLSTADCATEILRAYQGCGLSEAELADRVLMAAASAGVVVAIG